VSAGLVYIAYKSDAISDTKVPLQMWYAACGICYYALTLLVPLAIGSGRSPTVLIL